MVTKLAKKTPGRTAARTADEAAAGAAGDSDGAMSAKTSRTSAHSRARPRAQSNALALVTGASSGIGESLAHCFAKAGHDMILVARSADKLKALADELKSRYGVAAFVEAVDLSVPGAAAKLGAALNRKKHAPDVLVNCAGVLSQGLFTGMSAATQQQMIDLNISGLTSMISEFLPGMAERAGQGARGRILNVASIAAFQPIPSLATYAASKAFVLSLTESLSEELKGTGVTVTALCPGMTATAMLTGAASANDKVSQIPAFMVGEVNDVARQGFEACMRGDVICVPGAVNRAVTLGSRATPKWLVRKIGGLIVRNAL